MRTLMIDGEKTQVFVKEDDTEFASGEPSPQPLRAPRLFDVHLIAGATKEPYIQNEAGEAITVNFLAAEDHPGATVTNPLPVAPLFHTLAETPDFPDDGFIHVVVEPQPDPQPHQKGDYLDQAGTDEGQDLLYVPSLRLVQGAVRIKAKSTKLSWLRTLQPPTEDGEFELIFTVDGIELVTSVPFPGHTDLIQGGFLIEPRPIDDAPAYGETALMLSLLPDHPATLKAPWLEAWRNAVADKPADADPPGIAVHPRPNGLSPAFCWILKFHNPDHPHKPELADVARIVDAPPADLRIELLGSPTVDGAPNGVAELQLTRIRLAEPREAQSAATAMKEAGKIDSDAVPAGDVIVLAEAIPPSPSKVKPLSATANDYWLINEINADAAAITVKPFTTGGAIRIAHDEYRLAEMLRQAYRWETPRAIDVKTSEASFTESDRPLISGFVPVTRGWLQLPFPNLPPVDTSKDAPLIAAIGAEPSSAIDGFVRFGTLSRREIISGYTDRAPSPQVGSPWSATVDGARGGVVLAAMKTGTKLTVAAARAVLRNPRLSTRGLFWLSSDGPDALEALPRLSAGPGSFLDIPFSTSPTPDPASRVVSINLEMLNFSFDSQGGKLDTAEFSLEFNSSAAIWKASQAGTEIGKRALAASRDLVSLNPATRPADMALVPWPPVLWLRHDRLPLAANMPMTRAAASAIPPLESRELAPFARPLGTDATISFGTILWKGAEAFGTVNPAPFERLVIAWPMQPVSSKLPDRGIAFAALGVPGVEVTPPLDRAVGDPWGRIWFALRYDLPTLDEAFATASLPQVAVDKPTQPDELPSITIAPVATALDWPVISEFWKDQERRRQLALVADSYFGLYRIADLSPSDLKIENLLRGATWTIKTAFDTRAGGTLPYGSLTIDGAVLAGNDALLGLTGQLTLNDDNTLQFSQDKDPDQAIADKRIGLLGWSPSTFDTSGWRIDNSGVGTADPVFTPDKKIITRQLRRGLDGQIQILATATEAIDVRGEFCFWFKDVPLTLEGKFGAPSVPPDASTRFDSWFDPAEGFEWRFYRNRGEQSFRGARERIPLDGVALEPLRLLYLALDLADGLPTAGVPSQIDLLARISFGDEDRRPDPGGNLVVLTLKPGGQGLTIDNVAAALKDQMLRFALAARETDDGKERRVTVTALPKIEPVNGKPTLKLEVESLALPLCGQQIELSDGITWEWDPNAHRPTVYIGFVRSSDGPIPEGKARLSLQSLRVSVFVRDDGAFDPSQLELDLAIVITPRGCTSSPINATRQTLTVLGHTFDSVKLSESDGAVTLVANLDADDLTLAELFKFGRSRASFLLVAAAVADPGKNDGFLELDSGRFEGEIHSLADPKSADGQVVCQRMHFEVEEGRRPRPAPQEDPGWTGFLAVTGVFASDSAICWPRLVLANDASVARCNVKIDSSQPARRHHATLSFFNHRLAFDRFAMEGEAWTLGRTWSAFVTAKHQLSSNDKTDLVWTSVESIAFGPVSEIIPPLPSKRGEEEPVTFAPRYRSPDGDGRHHQSEMIQAGLGRLRTALEGALGKAFRSKLYEATGLTGIVAVGGFLGSMETDETWLLRLPFLVGIPGRAIGDTLKPNSLQQTAIPDAGIAVAWADVAPDLTVRPRTARAPANADERSLAAALRAGALVDNHGQAPAGASTPAMLVEQSFDIGREDGSLATLPFWLASAATLSLCLKTSSDTIQKSLSIVAGSVATPMDGRNFRRGVASVVWSASDQTSVGKTTPPAPMLISGGGPLEPGHTDFMSELWTGGGAAQDPDTESSYAAGVVLGRHARPLYGAVRTIAEGGVSYFAVQLPKPTLSDLPSPALQTGAQPRFADNARGFGTSPGTTEGTLTWLAPVLEGRVAAVRDDGADGSGIAGLGRSLALPAQAAQAHRISEFDDLARSLVWLCEKRIPVYLPLEIKDLQAPPFQWLQTVPRRARLPKDDDVAAALNKAGIRESDPPGKEAQAFVPSEMAALTIGERAGIVTARRTFLLSAVPVKGSTAFDEAQGRFGRPAQVGTSMRQWIRTPRPAPLPANTGAPERDRRPEASPLLPKLPLRFLVGPTDTIRGEATVSGNWKLDGIDVKEFIAPWNASFVAAPISDGVVSERWDGSLRLRVELDVNIGNAPSAAGKESPDDLRWKETLKGAIDPLTFLTKVLFPVVGADGQAVKAMASASLTIGNRLLQFTSLAHLDHFNHADEKEKSEPAWHDVEGYPHVIRSVVDLVLDLAEPAMPLRTEAGGIDSDIAIALSGSSASSVDLRLTVHPASWHTQAIFDGKNVSIALSKPNAPDNALTFGVDRPPTTLRWRLPVVTTNRGGLALVPTTLLFVDPAYEEGLANPPNEDPLLVPDIPNSPANRGRARAVFSADRARVNRRGSIAFMLDVRFEVPPSPFARPNKEVNGDLVVDPKAKPPFPLRVKLIPSSRTESERFLQISGIASSMIALASIYELSLDALTEADGTAAKLAAGDELVLTAVSDGRVTFTLWDWDRSKKIENVPMPEHDFRLVLLLTDEPVVEPPSALYSAVFLDKTPALSLPLHAQSPLPWRIDFRNLKEDFRKGLVRRSATFVWQLARPDLDGRVHVVKVDRNGQTYLPKDPGEFLPADRPRPTK
jgi:hypothetical protein